MRTLLHILNNPEAPLPREVIAQQEKSADTRVEVVDLNQPEPNYPELVEKIFAADSVSIW